MEPILELELLGNEAYCEGDAAGSLKHFENALEELEKYQKEQFTGVGVRMSTTGDDDEDGEGPAMKRENREQVKELRGQLLVSIANCQLDLGRAYSAHCSAVQAVKGLTQAGISATEARLVRARSVVHMERRDEMYYEDEVEHEKLLAEALTDLHAVLHAEPSNQPARNELARLEAKKKSDAAGISTLEGGPEYGDATPLASSSSRKSLGTRKSSVSNLKANLLSSAGNLPGPRNRPRSLSRGTGARSRNNANAANAATNCSGGTTSSGVVFTPVGGVVGGANRGNTSFTASNTGSGRGGLTSSASVASFGEARSRGREAKNFYGRGGGEQGYDVAVGGADGTTPIPAPVSRFNRPQTSDGQRSLSRSGSRNLMKQAIALAPSRLNVLQFSGTASNLATSNSSVGGGQGGRRAFR
ncbi:unnamed protein product [Amoebophrya sp. A25]|nr:unnamed protein product [Amoebophrya sp. A25]|eukprot:GSA25T00001645001.1